MVQSGRAGPSECRESPYVACEKPLLTRSTAHDPPKTPRRSRRGKTKRQLKQTTLETSSSARTAGARVRKVGLTLRLDAVSRLPLVGPPTESRSRYRRHRCDDGRSRRSVSQRVLGAAGRAGRRPRRAAAASDAAAASPAPESSGSGQPPWPKPALSAPERRQAVTPDRNDLVP